MARWMMWVGIAVFVAGMIIFYLGLYGTVATQILLLYGGIIMVPGLVLLAVGGALRFVGALLLVGGIVGTVLSVVGNLGLLAGIIVMDPLGYLIFWGIWWGPFMVAIGLISLVGARQSRGSPLTS